jgi:hypothetical protein
VEELLDLFSLQWAFIATHEDAISIFFCLLIAILCLPGTGLIRMTMKVAWENNQ